MPIRMRLHVMGGYSRYLCAKFHTLHTANSTLEFLGNWLLNVNILYLWISAFDYFLSCGDGKHTLHIAPFPQSFLTANKKVVYGIDTWHGCLFITPRHVQSARDINRLKEQVQEAKKVKDDVRSGRMEIAHLSVF